MRHIGRGNLDAADDAAKGLPPGETAICAVKIAQFNAPGQRWDRVAAVLTTRRMAIVRDKRRAKINVDYELGELRYGDVGLFGGGPMICIDFRTATNAPVQFLFSELADAEDFHRELRAAS